MPGNVERAIRATVHEGQQLVTPTGSAPFSVGRLGPESLVLLLGQKRAWTPIRWSCLEGIPDFLRGRGWVRIGGAFDVHGEPGTLDQYLKGCLKRATAG